MLTRLRTYSIVGLITLALLGTLELIGQFVVRHLEKKAGSGIMAENILSHQEPVLGFALRKNISEKIGPWAVITNELGFRSEEPLPVTKAANEVRVFIVGGSTVFGWGVEQKDSIPGWLERLTETEVRKHYPHSATKIRIVNAGVPWYASWHETATILFRLLPLQPDWIIVFDGLNDTALSVAPDWAPIHMGFVDAPTRIAYEKRRQAENRHFTDSLVDLSPTLSYLRTRARAKQALQTGTYHPEVWDQYLSYMHTVKTLTSAQGIRFSLFFQPVMPVDKEIAYLEKITNGTSMQSAEFAEVFRKTYLEGERRILADRTLPVVSLKSAFKNVSYPIYLDGLHYSDYGNRILAEMIFERTLKPALPSLLKPQAPLS